MAAENPFVDPITSEEQAQDSSFTRDSTLAVGRDASLTLGTDSLIVLDEDLKGKNQGNCCGIWPSGMRSTISDLCCRTCFAVLLY